MIAFVDTRAYRAVTAVGAATVYVNTSEGITVAVYHDEPNGDNYGLCNPAICGYPVYYSAPPEVFIEDCEFAEDTEFEKIPEPWRLDPPCGLRPLTLVLRLPERRPLNTRARSPP